MTKQQKHIGEEDFRRYQNNEMSKEERNLFERQLQRDPFAAEAMEGFQIIGSNEVTNDLNELKGKLNKRKKPNKYLYWTAAASVLLILVSGLFFYQVNKTTLNEQVALNTVEEKKEATEIPQPKESESRMVQTLPEEEAVLKKSKRVKKIKEERLKKAEPSISGKLETPETLEKSYTLEESVADAETDDNTQIEFDSEADNQMKLIKPKQETLTLKTTGMPQMNSKKESYGTGSKPDYRIRGISKKATQNQVNLVPNTLKIVGGKVVSTSTNEPLSGVNIFDKKGTLRTVTNQNGKFNLAIPKNDTNKAFIASYVGMESEEFRLSNETENFIQMKPDQIAIQEVVAIGYGSQKKADLTGSISSNESQIKTDQAEVPRAVVVGHETDIKEVNLARSTYKEELLDSKAHPNGGFDEYEKYLQEKCILPQGVVAKKKVVRLSLNIDSTGAITQIIPLNNPDSSLFELAKKIIDLGPDWQAEVKDGKRVVSKVSIKMKFKR